MTTYLHANVVVDSFKRIFCFFRELQKGVWVEGKK